MNRFHRPHLVIDIQNSKQTVFSKLPKRINLRGSRAIRLPLSRFLKYTTFLVAALLLTLGSASAPTTPLFAASSDTERQALESQLQTLEVQIGQYQDQIDGYQKQGGTLKNEIGTLNAKISKLNLEIKAINLQLSELNNKIADTQSKIVDIESSIVTDKQSLGILLRNLYESERTSAVEILLTSNNFSDVFNDLNNLTVLQNNVSAEIAKITDLRGQLQDQEQQLALAKADTETSRSYREAQKTEVDGLKSEKNKLLDITKGQESRYQVLLKQTKETAAQIRSRIFQLLGGGELAFDQAYKYAKLAGDSTGIRPAFLLAILDRESALGQNVGRCSYQKAMSPKDRPLFLALVSALNINPDTVSVSCPNKDGVYGGAMGPAQFIPTTWNLYDDQVSKITSHAPANPWNNADAFVATALYLKDSMKGCSAIYSSQVSAERCAAAKYYSGSRWRTYLWTYGDAVISRARSFQGDIDTLNSN